MRIRRVGVLVALAAALLGLAACGSKGPGAEPVGGGGQAQPSQPSASSSSGASGQATQFEGEAPVKAARAWSAAVGRSVNAGDASLSRVRDVATAEGLVVSRKLAASDIGRRATWPGPEPFTPVNVSVDGDQAKVTVCLVSRGWSRDRKTGKPLTARAVVSAEFVLRNQGAWKFVNLYDAEADCTGVSIPETKW